MDNNEILLWDKTKSLNDIVLVEMGSNDFTVSCTLGKINLWFGKQSSLESIYNVVKSISQIDVNVENEMEVVCDFGEIASYENQGCTVVSYAKNTSGGYKAIFTIPFHSSSARKYFIESIKEELQHRDVKKNLHWNGSVAKTILLFEELKNIPGLRLINIKYKENID